MIEASALQRKTAQLCSKASCKQKQHKQPAPYCSAQAAQPLSPSVRRVAAEHEVDVAQVTGTGKGGRITKKM